MLVFLHHQSQEGEAQWYFCTGTVVGCTVRMDDANSLLNIAIDEDDIDGTRVQAPDARSRKIQSEAEFRRQKDQWRPHIDDGDVSTLITFFLLSDDKA